MKKITLLAESLDRRKAIRLKTADWKALISERFDEDTLYEQGFLHYLYKGDGVLHVVSAAHRPELVELAIAMGVSVHECLNRRSATALHYAADALVNHAHYHPTDQAQTIKVLVNNGARVNAVDASGATALMRAIRCRAFAAVHMLIEQGADWKIPNKQGTSAMTMATIATGRGGSGSQAAKDGQHKIVDLLRRLR